MTDTNIVERVARAIHEGRSGIPWAATAQQDLAYRDARAAIAAMRDPSDAMVAAGYSALSDGDGGPADAADCHRAMIDAAVDTPAGREE